MSESEAMRALREIKDVLTNTVGVEGECAVVSLTFLRRIDAACDRGLAALAAQPSEPGCTRTEPSAEELRAMAYRLRMAGYPWTADQCEQVAQKQADRTAAAPTQREEEG